MSVALISAADENYAPLLRELLASLRQHRESRHVLSTIGIINAGLSPDTVAELTAAGCVVVDGMWPIALSDRRLRGRDYLKACVSRPFIPDLFPGHDMYVWLDADTWVQEWYAVDWLLAGAAKSGLAVVPQVDRAYGKTMRLGWLGPLPFRPRSFYYSNARKAFGGKIARKLFPFPTINAGVFAMRGDAPHWARWQDLIKQALVKGNIFTAEQLTLGMMIYLENYPAERLPSLCNWLADTKPLYDPAQRRFIEPYIPHQHIGIMHLSGYDAMRRDPAITTDVPLASGGFASMSLRYIA